LEGTVSSTPLAITPTDLHVVVRVGEETVADSHAPVLLEEKGLPARYYLPRHDVRADLLRPSDHQTTCPLKGQASYWSLEVGGIVYENIVWSYETPIPEAKLIAGLLCFYNDRVELTLK
jgi:uncharacterized protein (DUF427 family)